MGEILHPKYIQFKKEDKQSLNDIQLNTIFTHILQDDPYNPYQIQSIFHLFILFRRLLRS